MADLRPECAEAVGAFFLLLAGGGAILAGLDALAVSLAFGFTIAALVYALGHLCGAHFNPAITLAFAATGHFPWRRVPTYIAAQLAGATAGAFALSALRPSVGDVVTSPGPSVGVGTVLVAEALAAFLLAFVIIAVATDRRSAQGSAGLAIGLTVAVDALWAGPLTGASMNPARSIGPAVVAGEFAALWMYLVAPVAGACAAMLAYEWLRRGTRPHSGEALGALGPVRLEGGKP